MWENILKEQFEKFWEPMPNRVQAEIDIAPSTNHFRLFSLLLNFLSFQYSILLPLVFDLLWVLWVVCVCVAFIFIRCM